MTFTVRKITSDDAGACVAILNDIIEKGGSTAYEDPFTVDTFIASQIERPQVANVVLSDDRIVGFQVAVQTEPRVYSIASFTDRKNPVSGAGRALFAQTVMDCRNLGGEFIDAVITSDNGGGLVFYSKMGFEPHKVLPNDLTRANGTVVDRVVKRFRL